MRNVQTLGLPSLATLAVMAVFGQPISAQEQDPVVIAPCVAMVATQSVRPGQAAIRLDIELSTAIGTVSGFQGAEGSHLRLATNDELPRAAMANEGERPTPITMAANGRELAIWINTAKTEPGTYDFVLRGTENSCEGVIRVEESTPSTLDR
ncbi:MAG: hypothetical protein RQ751_11680 [Longimicrobiales bacterium]|nr:hypothetical protein [Longimicrobiales bacterium]